MSLDVSIIAVRPVKVFVANIMHNLNDMADAVGLYLPIWHPEQLVPAVSIARDLIPFLENCGNMKTFNVQLKMSMTSTVFIRLMFGMSAEVNSWVLTGLN